MASESEEKIQVYEGVLPYLNDMSYDIGMSISFERLKSSILMAAFIVWITMMNNDVIQMVDYQKCAFYVSYVAIFCLFIISVLPVPMLGGIKFSSSNSESKRIDRSKLYYMIGQSFIKNNANRKAILSEVCKNNRMLVLVIISLVLLYIVIQNT